MVQRGKALRECASQLKGVLTQLFQLSLDFNVVPQAWKESTIIPVPKKAHAKVPEDYRPVALTSVLCKCMERVVCKQLSQAITGKLDPLQFAYIELGAESKMPPSPCWIRL